MPPPSAARKQPMPLPTKVAVILLALQGVLLLLNSVLLWAAQDTAVDQLAQSPGADREQSAQQILLFLIAYGVMGSCAVLAAAFLPRRRAWARQVGLLVTSLLGAITLYFALLLTGLSPYNLLLLITSIAAVSSLASRETRDWVHGVVRTD